MDSNDKRFSKIALDPKFKRIPKAERKVKIDKRFQSIFNDKRFKVKYTIDKRGRPLRGSTTEDFKKFYHMSDEEQDDEDHTNSEDSDEDTNSKQDSNDSVVQNLDDQAIIEEEDNAVRNKIDKKIRDRLKDITVDYARGDGVLMTDSSSDDETSSDEEKEGKYISKCHLYCFVHFYFFVDTEIVQHSWGELDKDADNVEEATSRLALCNMDWDRIQAVDLMILFNSFLPTDGFIKSITVCE